MNEIETIIAIVLLLLGSVGGIYLYVKNYKTLTKFGRVWLAICIAPLPILFISEIIKLLK